MAALIFIPAAGSSSGSQLVFNPVVRAEDFDFIVGEIQTVQGDFAGTIIGLAPFEPSDGAVFGFQTAPPGPGLTLHVNFNGKTLYGAIPVGEYIFGDDTVPSTVLFRFDATRDYWTFASWADAAYSELNSIPASVLYSTLDRGVRGQVISPKRIFGRLVVGEDVKGLDRSEVLSLVDAEMRNTAAITTANSPYAASEGEFVRFDATNPAGGVINLPVPAIDSRNVTVSAKEVGGGTGSWSFVAGGGRLIDGQASRVISGGTLAYRAMSVRWDGAQWRVVSSFAGFA